MILAVFTDEVDLYQIEMRRKGEAGASPFMKSSVLFFVLLI